MENSDTGRRMLLTESSILWVGTTRRSTGGPTAEETGPRSVATGSAADALELLRRDNRIDSVVIGPDSDTDLLAFLQAVRIQAPSVPVFLVDDCEDTTVDLASRAGVTDCLDTDRCEADRKRMLDVIKLAAARHRRSGTLRATTPSQEAVIEKMPDGIGIVREGTFVAGNRTIRDLIELGNRSFDGIEPCDIVDPTLLERLRDDGSIERQTGVPLLREGEPTVLADVTAMPIEWHGQSATLLVCRDRSLTGSNRVPEAKWRLQKAMEAAGHAVYTTGPDGVIQYVNAAFEEITGYTREEVLGETPKILGSGLMPEEYYRDLWDTVLSGETWQEVVANRRKNGDVYYADQTIAPITNDGEIQGFIAIQSDITTKKESEDNLRVFSSIVERIDDPIMIQDIGGNFRVVNDAVSDLSGLSKGELIGKDEFAFMDEESAREVQEMKARALEQGEPVTYELSPELPANGERTFSTVRYPEYDSDGDPVGSIAICRDITEVKRHQRQFRVIERVLRHNLRNHIQVIRGITETINTECDDGDIQAYSGKVLDTTDALLETADKERRITQFLSNNTEARRIDLARVTRSAVDWARREFPDATITVDAPEQCFVSAAGAIERAIRELIENAIVHSDRSAPSVEITVTHDTDSASVTIADEGPGIPEMERNVLSGRKEIKPLHHGRGIGMWMVNLIVGESDGSMEFTENGPRGSVVTVTLPRPTTD